MRPNVLWILTDQFNANCLSFLGSQARTPNLDRLAAEGVSFSRAYCNNPICAPSRACFLTGQYVHTHGLFGNRVVEWPKREPNNLPLIFRQQGYRTAQIGKAHLPRQWVEEAYEHVRLVDVADAWPHDPESCHYFKHLVDEGVAGWYEDGSARPGSRGNLDGSAPANLPYKYSNEAYTGDETLKYLEHSQGDERPFFLAMSFERPHAPMTPAREYFDLYDPDEIKLPDSAVDWFERRFEGKPQFMLDRLRGGSLYPLAAEDPAELRQVLAAYYALITCIDMEIGRALDWLRAHGQYENTIIVFTADHGDFAGEHGLFHKNLGIYESLHRIPFLMKTPGGPRGERRGQMIESIDLFPTLCDLAELATPETVEGKSFAGCLEDATAPGKEEALAEWGWLEPIHRINALRTARYRLVYYSREQGGELYDHATDPGEVYNLWDSPEQAGVRFELLQRLFDRVNQYRAPLELADDLAANDRELYMPSRLVQFGKMDWEELKALYQSPRETRGPWPPE